MKPRFGSALLGLAVLTLGSTCLKAEEPGLSSALKLRGLLSSSASDRGLSNNIIGNNLQLGGGFGLELGYTVGSGKITGELGYSVQSGDAFLASTGDQATRGTAVVINTGASVDSRKNKLEGLTLRLGYEAPLSGSLSWRAGLQFGGNKFTHQVLGNVSGTVGTPGVAFADSYYYVGSESKSGPSPYAGLTYKFDDSSALEFGVLLLQYSQLNYQHVANSKNQYDSVASNSRILPTLEVGYVFRF